MKKIEVVIETPKESGQKYDYDPETKFFKLKKILPSGMVFPFDFGFIPHTKGDDGDPLDIIVISDSCSFPGCMMECRLIGGFKAMQTDSTNKKKIIRNDRFMGIPSQSVLYQKIKSIEDLPDKILQELEDFFINYNKIQNKKFKILSKLNPASAIKIIKKASS
jgi:inorganic pyrophosphatase